MNTISDAKLSINVLVLNRTGIHLRAARMICELLQPFHATAKLLKKGIEADCRSILQLLSLGAGFGEVLTLSVEGEDAQFARDALVRLFIDQFYEM